MEGKKVLFISGTLPPEGSATANVIAAVSKELQKKEYSIDGLTVKINFDEKKEIVHDEMQIYKADMVLYTPAKKRSLRDVLFAIQRRVFKRKSNGFYKEWVVKALVKRMESLPMEQYDWIIAVCAYYEAAEAILRYKEKHGLCAGLALYQVDPVVGNEAYRQVDRIELERYEKRLYGEFDHVFTTPIIFKEKQSEGWDTLEVTALELPISTQPHEIKKTDHEEIRCVYAGYLYGALRDAGSTLALFSKMKDPRIQLYFVGKGQEKLLESYAAGSLKDRLHILGPKTARECDDILSEADVLINIGNTVNNQLPSKLLHYFGFGKPVLNIVACEECPSLPYAARYPLVLSVDGRHLVEESAGKVENWILECYRSSVPHEQIMETLKTCTPKYIAKQISDVLEADKING